MTRRSRYFMLLNDSDFPIPVLHVLLEEGSQRGSRLIPALDSWRLPDSPPSPGNAQIEFIVLVSDKFFVKQSDLVEDLTRPTTEIDRV